MASETTQIKLKTTESAQQKFTSQVALTQVALQAGVINLESQMSVWDYNDTEKQLTVQEFLGLILRYGMYCQALFANYAP